MKFLQKINSEVKSWFIFNQVPMRFEPYYISSHPDLNENIENTCQGTQKECEALKRENIKNIIKTSTEQLYILKQFSPPKKPSSEADQVLYHEALRTLDSTFERLIMSFQNISPENSKEEALTFDKIRVLLNELDIQRINRNIRIAKQIISNAPKYTSKQYKNLKNEIHFLLQHFSEILNIMNDVNTIPNRLYKKFKIKEDILKVLKELQKITHQFETPQK